MFRVSCAGCAIASMSQNCGRFEDIGHSNIMDQGWHRTDDSTYLSGDVCEPVTESLSMGCSGPNFHDIGTYTDASLCLDACLRQAVRCLGDLCCAWTPGRDVNCAVVPGATATRDPDDVDSGMMSMTCTQYRPHEWCEQHSCAPKTQFIGIGFDITKDVFAGDAVARSSKWPIFLFDQAQEVTGDLAGYTRPQQVRITEADTQRDGGEVSSFSSLQDLQVSLASSIEGEGSYGVGNVRAKLQVSSELSTAFAESRQVSVDAYKRLLYTLTLEDSAAAPTQWTSQFQMALDAVALEDFDVDGLAFAAFVRRFGTHFVSSVEVGGLATFQATSRRCVSQESFSADFSMQARRRMRLNSGEANAEGEVDMTSSSSSTVESWSIEVQGGSPEFCTRDECDINAFKSSVTPSQSEIISFVLTPIDDRLPASTDGDRFRDVMNKYIDNVVDQTQSDACGDANGDANGSVAAIVFHASLCHALTLMVVRVAACVWG